MALSYKKKKPNPLFKRKTKKELKKELVDYRMRSAMSATPIDKNKERKLLAKIRKAKRRNPGGDFRIGNTNFSAIAAQVANRLNNELLASSKFKKTPLVSVAPVNDHVEWFYGGKLFCKTDVYKDRGGLIINYGKDRLVHAILTENSKNSFFQGLRTVVVECLISK